MLVVHPKCGFAEWRLAADGSWELWKQGGDGRWDWSVSQTAKPWLCACGYPLVEMTEGTLSPLRTVPYRSDVA